MLIYECMSIVICTSRYLSYNLNRNDEKITALLAHICRAKKQKVKPCLMILQLFTTLTQCNIRFSALFT